MLRVSVVNKNQNGFVMMTEVWGTEKSPNVSIVSAMWSKCHTQMYGLFYCFGERFRVAHDRLFYFANVHYDPIMSIHGSGFNSYSFHRVHLLKPLPGRQRIGVYTRVTQLRNQGVAFSFPGIKCCI